MTEKTSSDEGCQRHAEAEGVPTAQSPSGRTKTCPRCGSLLFEDQATCYGCLYDFGRAPSCPRLPDPDATFAGELSPGRGSQPDVAPQGGQGLRLVVDAGAVRISCPIPERGLSLGRSPDNDIVIHSRVVSRHHVRVFPSPEGDAALVEDQGSTNPVLVDGRELVERSPLYLGSFLDIADVTCMLAEASC